MSRIDELIAEHCPDGVEYKPLGSVGEFIRGNGLQKKDLFDEGIPAVHYGQIHTRYGVWTNETVSFTAPEIAAKLRLARAGDLLIATTSEDDEAVAKATAWLGAEDVVLSSDAYIYRHQLDPRFVAYFFQSEQFQNQKQRHVSGTKVRRISGASLSKILIPVPPLEVQRAIVEVLDTFSKLEAELEAELEARKQQYEHYRNRSFEIIPQEDWVPISQLGAIERGSALQKKDLVSDGVPAFHYGQVYTHYGPYAIQTKSFVSRAFASGKRVLLPGDVFIATTSENEEDLGKAVAWLGDTPAVASSDAYIFRPEADARYISYFFGSRHFQDQKKRFITGTKVKRISGDAIGKIRIPRPTSAQQSEIADQLDKFDALVNDLSIGLPAELAARRQQYEYYRDKLLTFKELEVAA